MRSAINRRIGSIRLSSTARAVRREGLTYLNENKLRRLDQALRRTRSVPGDLVEFGVALGGSGILMAQRAKPPRSFIGFDVFGMIPPPQSPHDDEKSRQRYEAIRGGESAGIKGEQYYGYRDDLIGDVRSAFARYGVPEDGSRVRLVKGLFEESWPDAGVSAVAMAHIDCDWYDPVRYCLECCAEVTSVGSILVIDDYHDYGGCRTAVDEFLQSDERFVLEDESNPYIIRVS